MKILSQGPTLLAMALFVAEYLKLMQRGLAPTKPLASPDGGADAEQGPVAGQRIMRPRDRRCRVMQIVLTLPRDSRGEAMEALNGAIIETLTPSGEQPLPLVAQVMRQLPDRPEEALMILCEAIAEIHLWVEALDGPPHEEAPPEPVRSHLRVVK